MDEIFTRLALQAYCFPRRNAYALPHHRTNNLTGCQFWLRRLKSPTPYHYWTQAQLWCFQKKWAQAENCFQKAREQSHLLTDKEQQQLQFAHQLWQQYHRPDTHLATPIHQTLSMILNPTFYSTSPKKVDIIVVLGHQLLPNGKASKILKQRLQCAAQCAERYPESPILLSGKGHHTLSTEAEKMQEILQSFGIKSDRIHLENQSMNTLENAEYSLYSHPEAKHWLIVTDWDHQPRSQMIFRCTEQHFIQTKKMPDILRTFSGISPQQFNAFSEEVRVNTHIDTLRASGIPAFYCPPYSAS